MLELTQHRLSGNRWWRGLASNLRILLVPFGRRSCRAVDHLATDARRADGLVIVLPGIEGRSTLNADIALGLADGGVDCAVEVHDWTTGRFFNSFYHLRSTTWHAQQAQRLADRIAAYQDAFPGRPVVLVGHSGGAALSLLTLPLLKDRQVSGAVLLAAATSPGHDTIAARRHTRHGIWSFHSPFDWLQLGLGTFAVGTFDGRHTVSSGMVGFREARGHAGTRGGPRIDAGQAAGVSADAPSECAATSEPQIAPLRQVRYRFKMLSSWNLGGHHGWANHLFAAEWLAPVVLEACGDSPFAAQRRFG